VTSVKISAMTAHVDGAARGNPGPAAAGVVFRKDEKTIKTLSIPIGSNTNNVAEYCALILALQEALMMNVRRLDVFTDSELVTKQFSGEYKVKEPSLKALHCLASHLREGFEKLTLTHVPRAENKLADEAANKALDRLDFFV
jgi:ribonuclease HI